MLPTEINTNSLEGLARLFWFAVDSQGDGARQAVALGLKDRLDIAVHQPRLRGAFEDAVRHLDSMEPDQRFEAICSLIAGGLKEEERLEDNLAKEILSLASGRGIVRYSFAASLLPCLRQAYTTRLTQHYPGYNIRFSDVGPARGLMASLSLYLDLPIYTETGPPWAPDPVFDDGEPNNETPDLEISFPPASFRASDAPNLEDGIRKMRLPRAIDRGNYDLESVMLAHLAETGAPALAMVSKKFLSSPTQSRLSARQRLLDLQCIHRIAKLEKRDDARYLISLWKNKTFSDEIAMISTNDIKLFVGTALMLMEVRQSVAFIPVNDIKMSGSNLMPTRYLDEGPVGGPNLVSHLVNSWQTANYRLVDFFDIIRPKTIKDDPVGTFIIEEVSGKNITEFGEVLSAQRHIKVRPTVEPRLDEQRLRPGDILFVQRGPIGRVAYISRQNLQDWKQWAGQTLLILRERKRSAQDPDAPYCDPRVLFMYLMTTEVKQEWQNVSTNNRIPFIPIGNVERFSIPKSLTVDRALRRSTGLREKIDTSEQLTDLILVEFKNHQENIEKLQKLKGIIHDGLKRVWNTAWSQNQEN